jgi:hypothetical protein
MRACRITACLVVAAAVLGGCAGGDSASRDFAGRDSAAGCTPPAHESELLDAYAADPVFAVRPPDAREVGQPARTLACRVDPDSPDDPTQTAVSQQIQTAEGYDAEALRALYDKVAAGHGWRPVPPPRQDALRYCRQVRGVTSYLSIAALDPRPQAGVRGPAGATPSTSPRVITLYHHVFVRIAAAPEQPACAAN